MTRSAFLLAILAISLPSARLLHSEQVAAYTLDGKKIEGRISNFLESNVAIETQTGVIELPFGALDRIELTNSKSVSNSASDGYSIANLIDGSPVFCQEFIGRDDRWTAQSSANVSLEFPKGTVESLLMRSSSDAIKREWLNAAKEKRTSDEMVIARIGNTIDRASGMIIGMTPEVVEFSFDGQILQAPRVKLFGLLWYRSQERRAEPAIQVRMKDGSRWEVSTLSLSEPANDSNKRLNLTTPCGVQTTADWDTIQEINFSAANVVWLASQPALSKKTFQRAFMKETIAGRDEMLGPRFFSADGSQEAKSQDLNFVGPGEVSFRIPVGFKRFVAKIRRSDKTRFASAVQCQVWVGDDLAWSTALAHDQLETTLDVPVVPEKRLRIVVECESDLLLGTQLSWLQPRLTR